jgi:ABC-2 type transport system permease protein
MMDFCSTMVAVAARELRLLWRNPYLLLMIVGGPLLYPFLYNTAYLNKMEHDVPIAVVDDDRSESSRRLILDLDASELLRIDAVCGSVDEARQRLEQLSSMAMVVIPNGFETDLKQGKQARIEVAVDNVRFLVASDISRALGDVLAHLGRNTAALAFVKTGAGATQAAALAEPLHPVISNSFNATESYGDFIIVGLLVIILQQTLLLGMSVSMALEREQGLLPELFRTGKGSITGIIAGKGAFYLLLYSSHALLFYSLYYRIYSIPMTGSASALAACTVLFLASVIVWTMMLASFFKDKILAIVSFLFTSYPFFLMSGYSWPSQALPPFLKAVAAIFPITHYLRAYTVITQMSGGWRDIGKELALLGVIVLLGTGALWLRLFWLKKNNASI